MNSFALNPQQAQAVKCIDRPLLVFAGAGSGKTRVITEKIIYLIKACGLKAQHICAVTFTNKAAKEMQARIQRSLDGSHSRGLMISTFHTLGLKIIRKHTENLHLSKHFSIYDETDCIQLIKSIEYFHNFSKDAVRFHLSQISNWKNLGITPAEALSKAQNEHEQQSAVMYGQYQKHLLAYQAVDFDDLITLPIQLFKRHPDILKWWQNKIRYLLVDEYQDTNHAQYELIKLLVKERQTFTVVGDDDQSIYTWRGARPENLLILQQDFPKLKVIKLEQNYRSTNTILQAANQLISINPHIFTKSLWSEHGQGDRIRVVHTPNEQAEAEQVVHDILQKHTLEGIPLGHFAILYRGNHQAQILEQQLQLHRLRYKLSGGTSIFARTEIRDVLAYLKALINPEDNGALLRIINTPRRGIGAGLCEKIRTYSATADKSLQSALGDLGLENILTSAQQYAVQTFHELLATFIKKAKSAVSPKVLLTELLEALDYYNWLIQTSSSNAQAEKRWQHIQNFIDWLNRLFEKKSQEKKQYSLAELLNTVILIDQLEQNEDDNTTHAIQLLTLHAAKGLEFPHVYLIGFEENLLPHRTSIEEDNIVEERRLAYVGITRAQKYLTISLARTRTLQGQKVTVSPSRFIDELPPALLKVDNPFAEVNAEERKQKNETNIARLRALLQKNSSDK